MKPVLCESCRVAFATKELSDQQVAALWKQRDYDDASAELKMLLKVRAFYRRHSEAVARIQPHGVRVHRSEDPAVREQRDAGIPLDEIKLPPDFYADELIDSGEDREVIEYLLWHSFRLEDQLAIVSERLVDIARSDRSVHCPHCSDGILRVPREHWEDFAADDVVEMYYRPQWHSVDEEGNIEIPVSCWGRTSHSSGSMRIEPSSPDYDFWSWLIDQDKYYRPVQDNEFPAIRDEWAALRNGK